MFCFVAFSCKRFEVASDALRFASLIAFLSPSTSVKSSTVPAQFSLGRSTSVAS